MLSAAETTLLENTLMAPSLIYAGQQRVSTCGDENSPLS